MSDSSSLELLNDGEGNVVDQLNNLNEAILVATPRLVELFANLDKTTHPTNDEVARVVPCVLILLRSRLWRMSNLP